MVPGLGSVSGGFDRIRVNPVKEPKHTSARPEPTVQRHKRDIRRHQHRKESESHSFGPCLPSFSSSGVRVGMFPARRLLLHLADELSRELVEKP